MVRSLHLKDVGPAARFDLELGERLGLHLLRRWRTVALGARGLAPPLASVERGMRRTNGLRGGRGRTGRGPRHA